MHLFTTMEMEIQQIFLLMNVINSIIVIIYGLSLREKSHNTIRSKVLQAV